MAMNIVTVPIKSWNSTLPFIMTPNCLLKKVRKTRDENACNIICLSPDLVKACRQPGFPSEVADKIEEIILECFTHLSSITGHSSFYQDNTDESNLWYCYAHTGNHDLREKYLKEIVRQSIMIVYDGKIDLGSEPKHKKFENDFINSQISELHASERYTEGNETINYTMWRKDLPRKYAAAYKEAITQGKITSNVSFDGHSPS